MMGVPEFCEIISFHTVFLGSQWLINLWCWDVLGDVTLMFRFFWLCTS